MNQKVTVRNRSIIRCSLIGVGMNLFLAVFKILAGTMVHAHAIIMDGVNSLSDMTASVISILSSIIVKKRGDPKHPFGYGRVEYLSSMLIAMIILLIGIRSIYSSIESIIDPHDPPDYNGLALAIMIISLVSKLVYGFFMRRQGKRLNSSALIMSAADSMGDALISAGILAAMALYRVTGVDIEHYVSIGIALLIIRTGIEMIRECGDKVLGTRPDPALRKELISRVTQKEQVLNISNILLHNYGEGNYVGSVDIEVDEKLTAAEISRLTRQIIREAEELGVVLTSVGITGTNISDPDAVQVWDSIIDMARGYGSIKRVYSFIIDRESRLISFYVTQNSTRNRRVCDEELRQFIRQVSDTWPDMQVDIRQGIDT